MKTLYEVSRVLTFSFAMLVCGMLIGGACMAQKQKPVKPKTSSEIMKELKDKKQLDTHVVEDPAKAEGPAGAGIVWVGRIVPGSDPPKRSEWATVGEWVVFKIPDGPEVEIQLDGDMLRFVTRQSDGTVPAQIMFSGASNQMSMHFVKEEKK
jgi:hypothetical protein